MRRAIVVFGALIIAGACCVAEVPIGNADFSAGVVNQPPTGWDASQAAGTLALYDADGHAAPGCLRYNADDEGAWRFVSQTLTLQPQTDYVLTASLKSDGTTRPAVTIKAPGARYDAGVVISDGSGDWKTFTARFSSGDATEAQALVYGDHGPGHKSRAGQAFVDDISLTLASEAAGTGPVPGGYAGPPPGENLALGKSYVWSQKPNYSLSNDEADVTQLTDGEFSAGYFWAQKTTVGWKVRKPMDITIDLERPEPICGVSFRTAAGTAGVGWPAMIFILTSNDGQQFDYQGELVSLSGQYGLPTPQSYGVHRYLTDRLKTSGRYVKLIVAASSQFVFCDEIEVFRGDFPLADAQPGEPAADDASVVANHRLQGIIGVRLMYDLQDLRAILASAKIADADRVRIAARLDALEAEALRTTFKPVEAWRGLPYNNLHARIWAVNSAIRRAEGQAQLTLWQSGRWDMLDPFAPPAGEGATVNVPAMNGEYRSAAFNLTNYADEAREARIGVRFDDATDPATVTVHEVQYVQTQERQVIADALPVADVGDDGRAVMSLPAGATRQVWLTVHPQDVAPGKHAGAISVQVGAEKLTVPLMVEVPRMDFPAPALSLFCWDYVGDKVSYAPNFTDLDRMAANLSDHFADAPWLQYGAMPWPQEGEVDAQGHITAPMDFGQTDRWIARFPEARLYCMFMSYHSMNNSLAVGSERWKTAMGEWATAVVEHLRALGVGPERWCVLPVDEPSTDAREQLAINVANALHATQPELQIFEDTIRHDPTKALPELYQVSDILCPNLARLMPPYQKAGEFYSDLAHSGKRVFIYQCSGPHKLLDPHTYHRLEAWHAWALGATGIGFWGYVDNKPTGSSWDNFKCGGTSYSLVYADDVHLANSKQWEAVREGVEDYTYLAMLRDATNAREGQDTPASRHARELLDTLPARVLGQWTVADYKWADRRDRTAADTAREDILKALSELDK